MVVAGSPSRCLLLVEGDDDKHVVEHLVRAQSAMPNFETRAKGGFDNVVAAIGPEIKSPGRIALGVMVDANQDPKSRWQSIRAHLANQGITAPKAPKRHGTVIDRRPRIGVWMMPDNRSPGELENFIEELIPPNDHVWQMACRFIDAIPERERKFPQHKRTKAQVRAWLATRTRPRHMGEAIRTGDLKVTEPIAASLAAWLQKLFSV